VAGARVPIRCTHSFTGGKGFLGLGLADGSLLKTPARPREGFVRLQEVYHPRLNEYNKILVYLDFTHTHTYTDTAASRKGE
jgi:hypothetical protein